jgi:flagellar basal-body rod protein FlgF
MTPGIYSIASGLNARWQQQEVSAKNISGAAINGYKRQVVAFGSFQQVLHTSMAPDVDKSQLHNPLPYVHNAQHNLEGGAHKNTGGALDAAIDGPGFFEVKTPQGNRLTRNGHFTVNSDNQLVNQAGYLVLGDSGAPITINGNDPKIENDGNIIVDGEIAAKLRVVKVANPAELQSEGGELFSAGEQKLEVLDDAKVNAGCLESSNVELPQEMVSMIQNQRMYDLLTRALQTQDEGIGKGLQDISS